MPSESPPFNDGRPCQTRKCPTQAISGLADENFKLRFGQQVEPIGLILTLSSIDAAENRARFPAPYRRGIGNLPRVR